MPMVRFFLNQAKLLSVKSVSKRTVLLRNQNRSLHPPPVPGPRSSTLVTAGPTHLSKETHHLQVSKRCQTPGEVHTMSHRSRHGHPLRSSITLVSHPLRFWSFCNSPAISSRTLRPSQAKRPVPATQEAEAGGLGSGLALI